MSGKNKMKCKIISQEKIASDVFSIWIQAEGMGEIAKPGQFVSLFSNTGNKLLPRPISICEIAQKEDKLRLVYRVVGSGTKEFSRMQAGDCIDVLGPFGNGFPLKNKKAILIGGGVGIPPMLELAKQLTSEKNIVVGYRDELFLVEDLKQNGSIYIATEDGSCGTKGNVLDAIKANKIEAEVIYACGPTPMLRAIKSYAAENHIECYLSLEEHMACGVGACLACVCKSKEVDYHTNVNNKRVCKDGPVFEATEVEI